MTSADVVDIYAKLENFGIKIWVDGGWAVDALLGKQTRSHADFDIAIQYKDIPKLREFLEARGYREVERDENKKWNFVLGDNKGCEVDVHAFTFDDKGHVIEGVEYPEGSLTGTGSIDGYTVRCIDPEHLVKFHTGYKLSEKDFKDVVALCERFGIEYPAEYTHLKR